MGNIKLKPTAAKWNLFIGELRNEYGRRFDKKVVKLPAAKFTVSSCKEKYEKVI